MMWKNVCSNVRFAIDGVGGGGSSAPASAPSAPKPVSNGSAGAASATKVSTQTQKPAHGVIVQGGNSAPKENAFVALAKKSGISPQQATNRKAPEQVLTMDMSLGADGARDIEFPRKLKDAPKPKVASDEENFEEGTEVTGGGEGEVVAGEEEQAEVKADEGKVAENEQRQVAEEGKDEKGKPKPAPVDINQFEPEDRAFVKKMHPTASAHFREKVAKLRGELLAKDEQIKAVEEGGLPLNYYNHAEGYKLHPEYNKSQQNISYGEKESSFWKNQLISVKSGQPFYVFKGVGGDGRDLIEGPYQVPDDQRAKSELEISLQNAMSQAGQATATERAKLQQLQQMFKGEYDKNSGVIKTALQQKLGFLLKDGVDKETIDMVQPDGTLVKQTVGDIKKEFVKHVPAAYKDHPMTEAATQLFVAFQLLGTKLTELSNNARKTNITQQSVRAAEPPTNGDITTTSGRNGSAGKMVTIGGRKVQDKAFKFNPRDM